jgi:hypothetical protein
MAMDALRLNLDENHSRALARSCGPTRHPATIVRLGKALAVAGIIYLGACKQPLLVGEYRCPVSSIDGGPLTGKEPISVPWTTGFENQLDCDYKQAGGSCYGYAPVSYRVVTSPVHSGQFAAEFTVITGTDAGSQPQGRCQRWGEFPAEAYYGAWYYIPEAATNTGLWNLFHFQGGDDLHGLWDVDLVNGTTDGSTGSLNLHVFGSVNKTVTVGDGPPVPIATWFHIVFYWKRAKDKSGEVALYQGDARGDVRVVDFTNLATDDTNTGQGQWYVGNLANALQPPKSTVYVDDITISATP